MASFGVAKLKDIKLMLGTCAPGHRIVERDHYYQVYLQRALCIPACQRVSTEARDLAKSRWDISKQMVRFLKIDNDCAAMHLPILGRQKKRS